MPIAPGLEDSWKYWVPQPMPADAVTSAPDSVRTIKLLDPACGSGHFLVIAFELLFYLYKEEARHRGESDRPEWSDHAIVESILENNLHGIDIDPRAVQIAAAALMLKAKLTCKDAEPRTLNLVAPNLRIADLGHSDPIVVRLCDTVEAETGIPHGMTRSIVAALAGADHLGSLLQVDTMIDASIAMWDEKLSTMVAGKGDQGSLFGGFGPRRRKRITAEHAKATLLSQLERFLAHHSRGADLGLRLRGEQLAAGVRFVRMVREDQYDLVVGNPPYQGTSKMADKRYIEQHYARGKADLYAAFLERGLQLVREGGVSAMITMRNWMFIRQFASIRESICRDNTLTAVGDLGWGAFSAMRDNPVTMSIVQRLPPTTGLSVAVSPSDPTARVRTAEQFASTVSALLVQSGRTRFSLAALRAVEGSPIIYWWSDDFLTRVTELPLLGRSSPARAGAVSGNHVRFLRRVWELHRGACIDVRPFAPLELSDDGWVRYVKGARGMCWIDPCDEICNWRRHGLEIKVLADHLYGAYTRQIRNEHLYFQPGIAVAGIGSVFSARGYRWRAVFDNMAASVFPENTNAVLCSMNSSVARSVMQALNPGVHFEISDVNRLPIFPVRDADTIVATIEAAFEVHERSRESSVEFARPGPSCWNLAQQWAQDAVDRGSDEPLVPFAVAAHENPAAANLLSFAIGVAVGRFGANSEGILTKAPVTALPHGILYLSDATDEHDGLALPASEPIHDAWAAHGADVDDKRTLKEYLRDRFFPDVHRKMYENRPIYFPLSSAKRTFVAYVSIHRWTFSTLTALLAEHLYPERKRLLGQKADLGTARDSADKKAVRAAEKQLESIADWLEELEDFIAKVEQIAQKGPPPVDAKTPAREVDAKFEMDLDDGVMINSAALWPLLDPQWKDPKKWWKELANAEGKKDYDWAHLAARYFPDRVDAKCKIDPSLAVAHRCFWRYHPEKAYQWELRLQDEIRPDFTIDEPGSDAARKAFQTEHPDKVEQLVTKEHQRRARKRARAAGDDANDSDAHPELALGDDVESGEEELSA